MTRFAWRALLQAGLEAGIVPKAFWQLTPAEFACAIGRDLNHAPLSRARLSELAQAFPDKNKDMSDG